VTLRRGGRREAFRRRLREKKPLALKAQPSKRREGEIMTIAKSPVITMATTTPVYARAETDYSELKLQVDT
jgi:hypothetical protein